MSDERDWSMDDVVLLIEIRGIYDGWSAAQLKDGRVVNRWHPDESPVRYVRTEAWLELHADEVTR